MTIERRTYRQGHAQSPRRGEFTQPMSTLCTLVVTILLVVAPTPGVSAASGTTGLVSLASSGEQGNGGSLCFWSSTSADGRAFAFVSDSTNLVPDDTNGFEDVFVRDQTTGTTVRASLSTGGDEANDDVSDPALSGDGRHVTFDSYASTLVPGDTNGALDAFLTDLSTGTTERVSLTSTGEQADDLSWFPKPSSNGRFVVFVSEASNLVPGPTNHTQIYVRDRLRARTTRVSVGDTGEEGNADSNHPAISADGRFVAFDSAASNMVPGDNNGFSDVFVRDISTGHTELVSLSSDERQGNGDGTYPSISAHGRIIAFDSYATNLVPGDTNGVSDAFVRDFRSGSTIRVSVSSDGAQGDGFSVIPMVASSGKVVVFGSWASNLVPTDTNETQDVFVHYMVTGGTRRVSLSTGGEEGNAYSQPCQPSADGRTVPFMSYATNLVGGDINNRNDVFVREPSPS